MRAGLVASPITLRSRRRATGRQRVELRVALGAKFGAGLTVHTASWSACSECCQVRREVESGCQCRHFDELLLPSPPASGMPVETAAFLRSSRNAVNGRCCASKSHCASVPDPDHLDSAGSGAFPKGRELECPIGSLALHSAPSRKHGSVDQQHTFFGWHPQAQRKAVVTGASMHIEAIVTPRPEAVIRRLHKDSH